MKKNSWRAKTVTKWQSNVQHETDGFASKVIKTKTVCTGFLLLKAQKKIPSFISEKLVVMYGQRWVLRFVIQSQVSRSLRVTKGSGGLGKITRGYSWRWRVLTGLWRCPGSRVLGFFFLVWWRKTGVCGGVLFFLKLATQLLSNSFLLLSSWWIGVMFWSWFFKVRVSQRRIIKINNLSYPWSHVSRHFSHNTLNFKHLW